MFFLLNTLFVSGQDFDWAVKMGGKGGVYGSTSIITDNANNVYSLGTFNGTVDFDLGLNVFEVTSNGLQDAYILKSDSDGNFTWVKNFGGEGFVETKKIVMDETNNLYIIGSYKGTIDFNPGSAVYNLTSNGSFDIFVLKLDQNGNFLWANTMGGTEYDKGASIAIDSSGNVYTTGSFQETVDFDTGSGVDNHISLGDSDIFIHKTDTNGNYLWTKSFGGVENDYSFCITTDIFGSILTTGSFQDSVDFDSGTGVTILTSNGDSDVYIQKIDSNGNFIWAKSFGGMYLDEGISLTSDSNGNIYTLGRFDSTVDFDPGAGVFEITSDASNFSFTHKLDSNGEFIWVKTFGNWINDIKIDASDNIYTIGAFQDTVDFDPGSGVYELTSNGYSDIFIQKLDSNGNFIWTKGMGSFYSDSASSLSINSVGEIYISGYFKGEVDFDPSAGTAELISKGSRDVFILKLSMNVDFFWVKSFEGIDYGIGESVTTDADGNVYTVGYYSGTIDFNPDTTTNEFYSESAYSLFCQKTNSNGDYIWTKSIGGSNGYSSIRAYSMVIDSSNNIFITGYFKGTVDFDSGSGVFELTSNEESDIFTLKLDENGNFLWANSFGGIGHSLGISITIDSFDNVITTGLFTDTVDFDASEGVYELTSNGSLDFFIQKSDNNGDFLWAKSTGGVSFDTAYSVITDSNGNILITGSYAQTVDFDPGLGVYELTSVGWSDIFIQKLDANGNFIWAKSMGGSGYGKGYSITSDTSGNIYSTGLFNNTVDFNPGSDIYELTSNGSSDIFIQKLDMNGNFIWAKNMGGDESDKGRSIGIDELNNVYVTGNFQQIVDFGDSTNPYELTCNGYKDIFIGLKYS